MGPALMQQYLTAQIHVCLHYMCAAKVHQKTAGKIAHHFLQTLCNHMLLLV